jgi:hypothetical protein
MKYIYSLLLTLVAFAGHAAQCDVSVKNEVKANGGWLMLHLDDGRDVEIDNKNQVYIDGGAIKLSPSQLQAVKNYRDKVDQHLQALKSYAQANAKLLDNIVDDVAASLGSPHGFDGLKQDLDTFWHDITKKYFNQSEVVLPAGSINTLSEHWKEHVGKAKKLFDEEFLDQIWVVLSNKMKEDGGLNLTSLGEMLVELEAQISERLESHSNKMNRQESNMCESLHDIVDKEEDLRNQIPELNDYRVFTI